MNFKISQFRFAIEKNSFKANGNEENIDGIKYKKSWGFLDNFLNVPWGMKCLSSTAIIDE